MVKDLLSCTILPGNIDQEIADTPRVTPLIVIPGNELDEVLVQGDASLGIEDGGSSVADEVGRDDILIGVLENALVIALRSSLDCSLDFIVGGLLFETHDEIDDGDVDSGNTEGETTNDRRLVRSNDKR